MEPRFFDTHCHLDLMLSPDAAASESAALGLGLFDCGVDPRDFAAAKKRGVRFGRPTKEAPPDFDRKTQFSIVSY